MRSSLYTLAGSAATALASVRGFNYASQGNTYDSFVSQFNTASGLVGADDFSSARLYTMIQDGTTDTIISAIPAAIDTKTTLLLGLWASEDQASFDNEITALKNAITQYGSDLASLVAGISVGSEDLYRISPTGIAADSGYGQEPDVLVEYISQVRSAISGTVLSSIPIGHVDTWNVFVNSSNSAVIEACDFLGLDEYPYYQTTDVNDVNNGSYLFFEAYDKVAAVAGGIPIWITETGWPVSGETQNLAVPSVDNAEIYWQAVACELEARDIDFWWYILADSGSTPSFGVTSGAGVETPLYNLACNNTSSSTTSAKKSTAYSTGASATISNSANATVVPTVYVTDVVHTTVTTCPVGETLTVGGSTTVLTSPSVITTTYTAQSTVSTSETVVPTVYVTDVVHTTVTTCPVGETLTVGGSTTVLTSASVLTSTYTAQSTVTTSVPVGAVPTSAPYGTGAVPAGTAASGTGAGAASTGGSTLASSWAASQTPTGSAASASASVYNGAGSKMEGSMAALALGAVAAVFAL